MMHIPSGRSRLCLYTERLLSMNYHNFIEKKLELFLVALTTVLDSELFFQTRCHPKLEIPVFPLYRQ